MNFKFLNSNPEKAEGREGGGSGTTVLCVMVLAWTEIGAWHW